MKELCIIVLGGTGFVGKALMEELTIATNQGLEVRMLVRNSHKNQMPDSIKIFQGSLPDSIPDNLFPQKKNIVIHLGTKNVDKDNSGFDFVNVYGTQELMKKINSYTIGIIYGSSLSVYGYGNKKRIKEDTPMNPQTDLARSRMEAEKIILQVAEKNKISSIALRPRFIIGEKDNYTIPKLIKAYHCHINVGDGYQESTYIEIGDYAKIICKLVQHIAEQTKKQKIINVALHVGYNKGLSLRELHRIFSEFYGEKIQLYIPIPKSIIATANRFNFDKIRKVTTLIELGQYSHSADVSLLEELIGTEITNSSPSNVIYKIIKKLK